MDIIKNRYWYFLISLLIIQHHLHGPPLTKTGEGPWPWDGFQRRSLLEVEFSATTPVDVAALYEQPTPQQPSPIQSSALGENAYAVRSKSMTTPPGRPGRASSRPPDRP
jgi:hypothetical protein